MSVLTRAALTITGSPTFNVDGSCTIDSTGADRVSAPASLVGATQGWFAARVRIGADISLGATNFIIARQPGGTSPPLLYFAPNGGAPLLTMQKGGPAVTVPAPLAPGAIATVIGTYDAETVKVSLNGAPFVSVANANVPAGATSVEIGQNGVGGAYLNGDVFWFACGIGTLTDADAAAINALGNSDPGPNQLPSPLTNGVTAVWNATDANYWQISTTNTVARDTINGWVSWAAWNIGLLSFDHSLFDGADVFGVSPLDASFGGTYDDVSSKLERITIKRGRNDNMTTMLAGEATVDLRDPTGIFNVDNAASPLYGQLEDRLHPVKLQSTFTGTVYPRFYGWVDQFTWQPNGRRGIAQLHCVDLFYWLQRATPIIASTGATTTGAAIGRILDSIGATDPAMRDLDVGDTIADFSANQAAPLTSTGTGTALELIGQLLEAERGAFFVAGTGKATYRSRLSRLTKTSSATIADRMYAGSPGVDFNQSQTRVTVQRIDPATGAVTYTAVGLADAASLAKIGYVDAPTISTPYLTSDSQADALALWIVSQTKSPKPPMYGMQIDNREASLLTQILSRELVDRITVNATRGGTSGDYMIDSLAETIDFSPGKPPAHSVQWLLSRASAVTPIQFDVSTFDAGAQFTY